MSAFLTRLRILTVPGATNLLLAPAFGIAPSVSASLIFKFPRACFVTGLMVLPFSRADAASIEVITAGLAITVSDENQEAIVSDGRGSQFTDAAGNLASVGADCQALVGRGFRPFPLQRPVQALDRWTFAVQNKVASSVVLGGIFLFVEDAQR